MSKVNTVYVDGVFDLFHAGHINFLKEAKKYGDKLLVGVITDKDVQSYKRTPIITHSDRVTMLKFCKLVDKVIEYPPLVITEEFLLKNKIDLVIHADDSKQEKFFKVPISKGIMKYIPYTSRISTTKLINAIGEKYGNR